jgi:protein TonB
MAIVVAGTACGSPVVTQATATQQPAASPVQSTAEKPWPPLDVSRVGRDVLAPRLVREVKPNYPAAAMRAKVEGIVTVDAVVNADGSVGEVRVARSVDREYGLDDEAVACAKKWRFKPASRRIDGVVVPVLVQIDIAFALPTK